MQETPNYQPDKPPSKINNLLQRLRESLTRRRKDKKEEKESEEDKNIAEWALMKFTSAEIQLPERTIYPNKYSETTTIREVTPKVATILRIKGGFRHRLEHNLWFVLVKRESGTRVYNIGTSATDSEVLKPIVQGYKLIEHRVFNEQQINEPVAIEFFLNTLVDYPHDSDYASTERIDIMFGGSPEKTTKAVQSTVPQWEQKPLVPQNI